MDGSAGARAGLGDVDDTLARLQRRLGELERDLGGGAPATAPAAAPDTEARTVALLQDARSRIADLTAQLDELARSRDELARTADELTSELGRGRSDRGELIAAIELGGLLALPEHLPAVIPVSLTISRRTDGLAVRVDPLVTDGEQRV